MLGFRSDRRAACGRTLEEPPESPDREGALKVLLATYGWWGEFPTYVARALRHHGVSVRECVVYDSMRRLGDRIVVRRVRRLRSTPLRPLADFVVRRHLAAAQSRLIRAASEWKPDLVLVLPEEWVLASTLRELRRSTGGALLTVWNTDDPFTKENFAEALPLYDYVFCFDTAYIPSLRAVCTGEVIELPIACDPEVYRPVRLTDEERRRYGNDVAFIGTWLPNRQEVLEAIADLDIGIWGWGKARRLPIPPIMRSKVRAGLITNEQANLVYNASRVVVNIHHAQVRNTVTRGFEAPASGAFQIIDEKPDLPRFFVPQEEVVTFRTPSELRALVLEYLADPARRAEIARRARRRVLAEHPDEHRVATLLEAVGWRASAPDAHTS